MQKISDLKINIDRQTVKYVGDLEKLNKDRDKTDQITEDMKTLKFNMHVFKSEVDVMKRTFTTSKLVQIDKNSTKINELLLEIEIL